jgi:iron complex transport system substrate-binding protein
MVDDMKRRHQQLRFQGQYPRSGASQPANMRIVTPPRLHRNDKCRWRRRLFTLLAFVLLVCGYPAMVTASLVKTGSGWKVTDQAGREIMVSRPFKRIISLYGAHTENLFQLGLDREIIGVSRNEAYPPRALTKPVFSYHEDPEKFLSARPDLVLIRPMIDRGYPQLVQRLEQNRIVVASLQPGSVEEMFSYWRVLGALTGQPAAADQMVQRFRKAVATIRTRVQAATPKKRVYFEAIHRRMKTFAPDSMAIYALESAGGINLAADARPVRNTNIAAYGKERILSHAKEMDVFLAQKGVMNPVTVQMIKAEAGFNILKAVRTGHIYLIDEMIVSRPTMRLVEGIHIIAATLYPQCF